GTSACTTTCCPACICTSVYSLFESHGHRPALHSFPTRRSSDLGAVAGLAGKANMGAYSAAKSAVIRLTESMSAELRDKGINVNRSEEHTSELQSLRHLVCRLLLEKKK